MPDPAPQLSPVNVLYATGTLDQGNRLTEVHLADGSVVRVPTSALFRADPDADTVTDPGPASSAGQQVVIPLVEEQLQVTKHVVETGVVRLHKTVQEFGANLDETLAVRTYDVERLVLNRPIDHVPETRVEGDTTIYPVVEEQLILTKQLILKEEVRVTRRDTERKDQRTVVLRREHLAVVREPST